MNRETILTIAKSAIIVLILLAFVFALRAPAHDLNLLPNDIKDQYVDDSGLPYFSEMDSYYNLRLTEDYIDHGYVGDLKVNGTEVDMHRYAPDGNNISYELGIVYVTSFLYDVANMFGDYSVREVAFWTGAIIASLAVIPAFIFARRLTNTYGAIAATLIIVLAPNYFAHTFPGFFDTDMFYYIFSLFFIFFFVESMRADNIVLKVVYAVLSIISIGLFSISWTGYIFYVGLMGIFVIVYLIVSYLFNSGDSTQSEYPSKLQWFIHQKEFLSIVLIGVIAFIGLAVFQGIDGVLGIFGRLLSLLSLQSSSTVIGGFPNVLVSVAEMQLPALIGGDIAVAFLATTGGVVNGIGGISILFAGLYVLYVFVSKILKIRKSTVPKSKVKGKPSKADRVSASKRIDDNRKFKFSLGNLDSFGRTPDEIENNKRLTILYGTLFVVWTLVTALAVTRGSRFITTIVLPFGLMAGIFTGYATDYVLNKVKKDTLLAAIVVGCGFLTAFPLIMISTMYAVVAFVIILAIGLGSIYAVKQDKAADYKNVPVKKIIAVALVILALVSPTICGAYVTANNVVPGTNDAMWNAMVWVNENSENNTVITSWWDFGYLFEIAADRQVTFDGGSQSGQRAFWLGQAMTTSDLELSAGIFRMLDSSGERAVDALYNITGDYGKTTDILLEILPMTPENATNTLVSKYGLTQAQAKEIVNYTHPENPRPVIFIASSDMLSKASWWSYFGAWNFTNQSSEHYTYYVPTKQISVAPNSVGKLEMIKDSNVVFNVVIQRGSGNNSTTGYTEALLVKDNSSITINGTPYNPLNISHIIVIENGRVMKNESVGDVPNANYTLFLMGENDTDNKSIVYTPILIDNKLVNSMFTQLYLLGGPNQDIFELVHMENGVSVWKIHFENTVAGGGSSTSSSTNSSSTSK